MILMLAPAPNMTFGGMPSGASYTSNQFSLIYITNDSTADQTALQNAGCYTLSPFANWGNYWFGLLSDLYAADSGTILPGMTGYPQHTVATVYNDGGNNGTWIKSGAGHGAGNWTQTSTTNAVAGAAGAAASATAAAASATAAAASALVSGGMAYLFDTATTDADPGSGKVRFNNATIASVTQLFYSDSEANGVDISAWLDTFDDYAGTIRGQLIISQPGTAKFAVFNVNGAVVNATTYRKVPVAWVAGTTLPDNAARVSTLFVAHPADPIPTPLAYASTTAGLAGTSNGQYFQVKQTYGDALDIYQNVSGVATYYSTVSFGPGQTDQLQQLTELGGAYPDGLNLGPVISFAPVDGYNQNKARVPTRTNPASTSNNACFFNSGLFSDGITTPYFAVGPGGGTTAGRLTLATSSVFYFFNPIVLPAGTHRLKFVAKANAGNFTLSFGRHDPTTNYNTASVDTSGWVTCIYDLVADGTSAYSLAISNGTGVTQDILIDQIQFYLNTTTLPAFASEVQDLSLTVNLKRPNGLPITPPIIDTLAANVKVPGYPTPKTFNAITVAMVVKQTGYVASRPMISAPFDLSQSTTNGFTRFHFGSIGYGSRAYLECAFLGTGSGFPSFSTDLMSYPGQYQIVILRASATACSFFTNEYEQRTEFVASLSPLSEAFFKILSYNNGNSVPLNDTVLPAQIAYLQVYDKYLSDANIGSLVAAMRRSAGILGAPVVNPRNVWFPEGDSITAGHTGENPSDYGHEIGYSFTPRLFTIMHGVSGSVLGAPGDTLYTSQWARQPRLLRNIARAQAVGANPFVTTMIGANDYAAIIGSPSAYYARLQAYWASIKATGVKLAVGTVLARGNAGAFSQATAFNAGRNTLNGLIRGTPSLYDAIMDFAADPTIGTDSAPTDPTLFDAVDELHPTIALGQTYLRNVATPVVTSFMV